MTINPSPFQFLESLIESSNIILRLGGDSVVEMKYGVFTNTRDSSQEHQLLIRRNGRVFYKEQTAISSKLIESLIDPVRHEVDTKNGMALRIITNIFAQGTDTLYKTIPKHG